jgi:hypothetical protein
VASRRRCKKCYSYVNGYCAFDERAWHCALCSAQNDYRLHRDARCASPPRPPPPDPSPFLQRPWAPQALCRTARSLAASTAPLLPPPSPLPEAGHGPTHVTPHWRAMA